MFRFSFFSLSLSTSIHLKALFSAWLFIPIATYKSREKPGNAQLVEGKGTKKIETNKRFGKKNQ